MKRFNKDFFFRFFLNLQFILIIFTIIFFSCNQKHEPEIAQIDGDIITLNVYLTRYQTFLSKTHQTDNLSNRYNLLNLLIDEAIIMEYAEEKGISEKIEKSPQMEKDKNQLLLNTFYKQEIKPKLIAGETELRRMYTWSKSSIHVRHLFSRTKQGILDIQNQLNSGDSWEKIALNCFTDPLLSSNGGDLGFRKLGELDPAFEEVAFQLTDGEISPPVMTGDGYSIIQLLEREYDPFLIENDYLLMKDRLDIIAKIYKKRPAVREYTDRVYNQLRLVFNHKNLLQLLSEIKSLKGEESVEIKSASPDLTIVKSLSLKTYWTSADILEKCRTLSQEKIARMNSVENAESIISGLFVREMLLKKAVESNLHHDADFMKQVDELKRKHIVQSIFYGIKNPDTEHDDSFRFNAFQDFIESLRKESDINIDSTVVKSFILEKRMYI